MFTIQAKIIAVLVLVVAFGGMWAGLSHYKDKAEAEEKRADMIQAGAKLYQDKVESQAKDVADYQSKLEAQTNENNSLRDAANSGNKLVYVHSVCTTTKTANTGTTEAYGELTTAARQDYFRLRQGIITLEANYALCLKELN